MKNALRLCLLCLVGLAPNAWAAQVEQTNSFLIEFSGAGPADLAAAVSAAGGTLSNDMSAMGMASAFSEDANFAKNLKKANGIQAVTRDLRVQWTPTGPDLELALSDEMTAVAFGSPGAQAHLPDPTLAFFGACQWANDQIDVAGAWNKGYFGDPNVKVAVLDTGVDPSHNDLDGQVDLVQSASVISQTSVCDLFAPDMDSFQDFGFHGTFVSGLVAAKGLGIAGVAPSSQIVAVKVLNCLGSGSFGDVIAGINYAASLDDVDVINMSLGAYFPKNLPGAGRLVAALNKAVNHANANGKLVVSAAGNDFADLQHDGNMVSVPAESGSGISTWAGDINGDLAGYSNHGVNAAQVGAGGGGVAPAVALPGCLVSQAAQGRMLAPCNTTSLTLPFVCGPNSYVLSNGTSFSAPLVAGVAALLDGKHEGALNGGQLSSALKSTADDIGANGTDNLFGHGRVNANTATDQ